MTVQELITQLQALDPTTLVVIPGYEGGLHDVNLIEPTPITLNINTEWYYGPHERGARGGFDTAHAVELS